MSDEALCAKLQLMGFSEITVNHPHYNILCAVRHEDDQPMGAPMWVHEHALVAAGIAPRIENCMKTCNALVSRGTIPIFDLPKIMEHLGYQRIDAHKYPIQSRLLERTCGISNGYYHPDKISRMSSLTVKTAQQPVAA